MGPFGGNIYVWKLVGWVFGVVLGLEDGVISVESAIGGDSYAYKVLMEDKQSSRNHGRMIWMKVSDRGGFFEGGSLCMKVATKNRLPTKKISGVEGY